MKLHLIPWQKHDFKIPLLALAKDGAGDPHLVLIANCVLYLDRAAALNLDAIVKNRARSKTVCSKTRAWIIDLEEPNGRAAVIFDRSFNVIGVAACSEQQH